MQDLDLLGLYRKGLSKHRTAMKLIGSGVHYSVSVNPGEVAVASGRRQVVGCWSHAIRDLLRPLVLQLDV